MSDLEFVAFGCALDALDAPEKVAMKKAYLKAVERGLVDETIASDPFDLLIDKLCGIPGVRRGGRVSIPTWLTPRPLGSDAAKVGEEHFRSFLDGDGCRLVSERVKRFVIDNVFPHRPLPVGVDHSVTGGVLEALRDLRGDRELTLLVLDSHFDAIEAEVRRGAGMAERAPGGSTSIEQLPDTYSCGTWLADVIERGAVRPERVFVVGPSDHPGYRPGEGETEGMKAYRRAYLSFEDAGVTVVPKRALREGGIDEVLGSKLEFEGGNVYVSFDVDLGAGEEVKAVRFLDTLGLSVEEVLAVVGMVRKKMVESGSTLAGLDVLEVDVHLADIPGAADRTLELCESVTRELIVGR